MTATVHALPQLASFEDWYRVYPKKGDKLLAKIKYEAIVSEAGLITRMLDRSSNTFVEVRLQATPDELMTGARRYRAQQMAADGIRLKDDGKFTCGAAVWLNRGRWMD